MKKAIIAVLILLSCGYIQAQNRNAEIIEDLCEEYYNKTKYEKLIPHEYEQTKMFEIGRFYVAGGDNPEYLHIVGNDYRTLDGSTVKSIGEEIYRLYALSKSPSPLSKKGIEEVKRIKGLIKIDMGSLKREYNRRIKEENFKKKNIRVNFKDVL